MATMARPFHHESDTSQPAAPASTYENVLIVKYHLRTVHQLRGQPSSAQDGCDAKTVEPGNATFQRPQTCHRLDGAIAIGPNPTEAQGELLHKPFGRQGIGHGGAAPPHRVAPGGKPADDDCCVLGPRLAPPQDQRLGWFFALGFHL